MRDAGTGPVRRPVAARFRLAFDPVDPVSIGAGAVRTPRPGRPASLVINGKGSTVAYRKRVLAAAAAAAAVAWVPLVAAGPAYAEGPVSFPGLSCTSWHTNNGIFGGDGFGRCSGSGNWTLNVGCNLNPTVLTDHVSQRGGTVQVQLHCVQGVNNTWITSP